MAEPTLLLDQLIITHNGGAAEFSYTWTKATGTLTTAGFREYGSYFTWMHVTHTLIAAPTEEISAYVYVTETMDSNDIVAALLAYLEGAITSLTIETISETDASASVTLEMEMSFYDFRQKEPTVSVSSNGDCTIAVDSAAGTSTSIQLAAVSGIAAARGRLIAWDRENAIYRSAMLDPMDFIPSLETQASVGKAQAVRGNIIHIAGHSDGYIVYSTSNIVRAIYTGEDYVFKYVEGSNYGVSDPRHISSPYGTHIFYTPFGLQALDAVSGQTSVISPELDGYLAQYPWPLRISYLDERYIVIGFPSFLRTDKILRAHRGIAEIEVGEIDIPSAQGLPNYPANAQDFTAYDRFTIFDYRLKKFGSCDIGAALLFSATPVNATGVRLGKVPYDWEEGLGGRGSGIGYVMPDKTVFLASSISDNSALYFKGARLQKLGWSTLLELHAEFAPQIASACQLSVMPYDDAMDTTTLASWSGQVHPYSPQVIEYMDVTAYTQDIKVSGTFNLTQLKAVMLPHGKI